MVSEYALWLAGDENPLALLVDTRSGCFSLLLMNLNVVCVSTRGADVSRCGSRV